MDFADKMYYSDPSMCTYCQNNGFNDKLVNGNCHRCITRTIHYAAATAKIREIFRSVRAASKR